MIKSSKGIARFLYLATILFSLSVLAAPFCAADSAVTYTASVSGGAFQPNPICTGMTATATLTGTLTVQDPSQEHQKSGDSWTYVPTVTGYAATSTASFGPISDPTTAPKVSGSPSGTITASADNTTVPGYYLITVAVTDTFTVTYNGTTSSQSASCSTTLEICVVGLGAVQYQDPDNGWVALPSPLTAMTGTTVPLRVLPVPADASFPQGQPTWGGIASGSGASASATFSTVSTNPGDLNISVSLGVGGQVAKVSSSATGFDLAPYMGANDDFQGRSETQFGPQERVQLFVNPTPDIGVGLRWSASGVANLYDDGNGTGDGQFYAGTSTGPTTFTVTVTQGPSKGKTKTVSSTTIPPSGVHVIQLSDGNGNPIVYHETPYASVGFPALTYLRPTNVSFYAIQVREEGIQPDKTEQPVIYQATGALSILNGKHHISGGFFSVSRGDVQRGCHILAADIVYTGGTSQPPYEGFETITIPQDWRVDTMPPVLNFTTETYISHIYADGSADARKADSPVVSTSLQSPNNPEPNVP